MDRLTTVRAGRGFETNLDQLRSLFRQAMNLPDVDVDDPVVITLDGEPLSALSLVKRDDGTLAIDLT